MNLNFRLKNHLFFLLTCLLFASCAANSNKVSGVKSENLAVNRATASSKQICGIFSTARRHYFFTVDEDKEKKAYKFTGDLASYAWWDNDKREKKINILDKLASAEAHACMIPIELLNETAHTFDFEEVPPVCFIAGTEIATPSGSVPIESLKTGDAVLSYDVEKAMVVVGFVTETFNYLNRPALDLEVSNGVRIGVTPEHPFYLPDSQTWVPLSKIKNGTHLLRLSQNGETVRTVKISEIKEMGIQKEVYNIHVYPHHNYFAEGILVHNY